MAYRSAPPPSDSITIELDGFALRLSRSALRGKANVTVLQHGRAVVVGRANREQLASIIDAASARRSAMARSAP